MSELESLRAERDHLRAQVNELQERNTELVERARMASMDMNMSDKKDSDVVVALRKFERRERIATACLQGILANRNPSKPLPNQNAAARIAKDFADALIEELGEPFP